VGQILTGAKTVVVLYGRTEDNSGAAPAYTGPAAGILTLSNLVANQDRVYIGYDTAFDGFAVLVTAANGNPTLVKPEYYNGTAWKYLTVTQQPVGYFMSTAASTAFMFAQPDDWATILIDSQRAFWIRFKIMGNTAAQVAAGPPPTTVSDIDAACTIDLDNAGTGILSTTNVRGLHAAQFASTKLYVFVTLTNATLPARPDLLVFGTGSIVLGSANAVAANYSGTTGIRGTFEDEPSTIAVIPQFDEAYVAYRHHVTRWNHIIQSGDTATTALATVEGRDFAVGTTAPFDPEVIAQLQEWPPCRYISFFAGRLWAAHMLGEPFTIRWSAGAPYHRVWTSLAYEYLMEDDNSPITGIHPLGEHMVVFKRDSVWIMVPTGENPSTGVESYIPKRVVAGVGCVANGSIKQIRGRLIFLSEEGVYAFDGTPAITKVTERGVGGPDRLHDTIAAISKTKRRFASAAHWRSRRCYLLSFATTGTVNNKTIVWEYDSDRWWVWDSIEAQHWLEDEGASDEERLYFGDSTGRIFRMGYGRADNGVAIDSHVETQRVGYDDENTYRLRSVVTKTTNNTREISIEATANDGTAETETIDTTDPTETDWDELNWPNPATSDSDNWPAERRRGTRSDMSVDGDWLQVKLIHDSEKSIPFKLGLLKMGVNVLGKR
jgi:hypothetical protein